MTFFQSQEDQVTWQTAHTEVKKDHQAKISHELIAAAASYEAAKAWESHKEKNGEKPSHEKAKEIFAGVIGAFVDREVETRGLDFADREKAKHAAKKQAENALAYHY